MADSGLACADTDGNCYGGCGNGYDDAMCASAVVAAAWAIRSAYTSAALVAMGGAPAAGGLLVSAALGGYSLIVGLVYCGED